MGLMLGILVGGGFFILKLDDYFKELNFYRQSAQKAEDKSQPKAPQPPTEISKNLNTGTVPVVSQTKEEVADSSSDETTRSGLESDSSLVVKKDELLALKQIEMINLTPPQPISAADSLLEKTSGIRDDKNAAKSSVSVEFWLSPINYKGYKMAKNKVVLFGVSTQEDVALYKLDEAYYIRLQQGVFKLEFTNDYRQMERMSDEALLARLK